MADDMNKKINEKELDDVSGGLVPFIVPPLSAMPTDAQDTIESITILKDPSSANTVG